MVIQAASRLEINGPNRLSPPKDKPEWLKYLLQYTNPLLAVLIVAGVLTFVAYGIQVLHTLLPLDRCQELHCHALLVWTTASHVVAQSCAYSILG
jgi:magnesium-transporting ATPase (P-type)